MDITCDGIVIRETSYGESDKILTLLTGAYGKITVAAKGVRSIKSKNSSAVQLFCYSYFELVEKNGRYTLKTATINDSFYAVRDNIECFALASYFSDVSNTVCSENNDEREMLRLILNSFYAMAHLNNKPLWKIKAAFEIKCMAANGLAPDFSSCAECGKPSVDSTDRHGVYIFSPGDGSPICPECLLKKPRNNIIPVTACTIDAVKYILSAPQSKMLGFTIPDNDNLKKEFCDFCEKYLCYQTSRRYETLAFYKSVAAM